MPRERWENTGRFTGDGRTYFRDPETGMEVDVFPESLEPTWLVIETGLSGPGGVAAVRVKDPSTGTVITMSEEVARNNPNIGGWE